MRRGLLIGLVLGFALGGVSSTLLHTGGPEGPPPTDQPPPGPGGVPPPLPAEAFAEGRTTAPLPPAGSVVGPSEEGRRTAPPPGTGASRADRDLFPERAWRDEELIGALRTLLSGESLGIARTPLWEGQRIVSQIWGRQGLDRPVRMPADLVAALLDSGDSDLRVVGAGLVALADPPMIERIRELALRDPDVRVRRPAVGTIVRIARAHPELVEVLTSAAGDASPQVRISALNALANLCSWRPGLCDWVASGTRDPDPDVREYTIGLLRMAGPAGTARATELLLDGAFDLDTLPRLLKAAVRGGGIGEILSRHPRPEVVTMLVGSADTEEDKARLARAFAGRFEELLPLYQPEEDSGYADFFALAAAAKELAFLREVIASGEQDHDVRMGALEACLREAETRRVALEGIRAILRDPGSPARFREEVVADCLDWGGEEVRELPQLLEILEEAARDDPSPWARAAAESRLRELR